MDTDWDYDTNSLDGNTQLEKDFDAYLDALPDGPLSPETVAKASADIFDKCTTEEADEAERVIWQALWSRQMNGTPGDKLFQVLATVAHKIDQLLSKQDCNDWYPFSIYLIHKTTIWQTVPSEGVFLGGWGFMWDLIEWKNLNSFFSYLVDLDKDLAVDPGILEISHALENPTIAPLQQSTLDSLKRLESEDECKLAHRLRKERIQFEEPEALALLWDCRVWIATEYLLNGCETIFLEMTLYKDEKKRFTPPAAGPLYGKERPLLGLDRWEFWKSRLAELLESDNIGLTVRTKERVAKTIVAMDECQSKARPELENQ